MDTGRKLGTVSFLGEAAPHPTQCGLGRGLPAYQVALSSIQLFGHMVTTDMDQKLRVVPFLEGELGPHLTLCGLGRGLPTCQVSC